MKALDQEFAWISNYLLNALLEIAKKLPFTLQAIISSQLGVAEASEKWRKDKGVKTAFPLEEATWSKSTKLRVKTGKLLRSFAPGRGTQIKRTDKGVVVEIGSDSPYWRIHETGGFIASKGRMHKWFWAMYYKTKMQNPFFKIMALSVLRRGGVTIPQRPYVAPAEKEFEEKVVKVLWQDIANKLAQI